MAPRSRQSVNLHRPEPALRQDDGESERSTWRAPPEAVHESKVWISGGFD